MKSSESMTLAETHDLIESCGVEMTPEEMTVVRDRVDYFKTAVRELDQLLNGIMLQWLDQPGNHLEIGPKRYYIGTKKKTVCGDVPAALEAVLTATGGDLGKLAELLGSQPLKYGACREVLGDAWGDHFTEVVEQDLKTGKPLKAVKVADERFSKPEAKELSA